MLHAITLLAAEASKPSKVPFYICGGLLAVWAVVLSYLGLQAADFPGNAGGGRTVMGITALLVVAAMTTAVVTS
jgi:hypothetical protein